jgi:uncharacterized protein YjdB
MKTKYLLIFSFVCSFFLYSQKASAQIDGVSYQLKYNIDSCVYDVYLVVNSGVADIDDELLQFNANVSFVMPQASTFSVVRSYNPKPVSGSSPSYWDISSNISNPASAPGKKFISMRPNLNLGPHYYANPLSQGDTVKLFSVNIGPINNCSRDIRMFINGSDPASTAAGMGGLDFNNGFTIGSTTQVYEDNADQDFPPSPIISDISVSCGTGIEIDLTASTKNNNTCQAPLSYAWTGPVAYTGTSQDVNIPAATVANQGNYKVIITDAFGCKDSIDIDAYNKPVAGPDQVVCAGTSATIQGAAPNTGTWAARITPANPPGVTALNPGANGLATVVFSNSASGNFFFVYDSGTCTDTMRITVNPKPVVGYNATPIICDYGTITLTTNQPGQGTWMSNDIVKATVNPTTGVVTPKAQGLVSFTFTNTSNIPNCASTTTNLQIDAQPPITQSTDSICIGNTSLHTPISGGTWTSTATAIATITSGGIATGVAAGVTNIFFKANTGAQCNSDTISLTVLPKPTTTIADNDICVGTTTTIVPVPASVGTWASVVPSVATVNNAGTITGVSPGTTTFVFTQTATGCSSNPSAVLTVSAAPDISAIPGGPKCIGSTFNLTTTPASVTGWVANNPTIATITPSGTVTMLSNGSATFTYTNANGCFATTPVLVVSPQPTLIAADPIICVGTSTTLSPATGGTWTRLVLAPQPISYSGSPVPAATGLVAGTGKMRFQSTATGCSDTLDIVVNARPVINITGNDSICVGTTTTLAPSPAAAGVWSSGSGAVATITNAGLVTGVAPGFATFIFTSNATLCPSLPSLPVTVVPSPNVSVAVPNICIGDQTNVSVIPFTAGTWASSNVLVATVTNAGLVTGLSAGFTNLTFTESLLGCSVILPTPITVFTKPVVSITDNDLCITNTTQLSPNSGGTWTAVPTSVATVTNAGVVTAVAAGNVSFTYQATGSQCSSNPLTAIVRPKPSVNYTGPTQVCVGDTTYLSPVTGGTWVANTPTVASVNNAGLVIGLANGTSTFTFTSSALCPSDATLPLTVESAPTVGIGPLTGICIGATTTLTANTAGTWVSNTPSIATVTPAGVVTGVAAGEVAFTFTSATGCKAITPTLLKVNPKPVTALALTTICVGKTTTITPTTGGSWISSLPSVATVTNTGLITGVGVGTVTFTYTNTLTNCPSDASAPLTVTKGPDINAPLDVELCLGETTTIATSLPATGTWESNNPGVASITPAGSILAIAPGLATFTFTDNLGCKSAASVPLTVLPKPTITVNGLTSICIGGLTDLNANTSGTWTALFPAIATIDATTGQVLGVSAGDATFQFTSAAGCPSDISAVIRVGQPPVIGISGRTNICIADTTNLFPKTGGVWTSNNPDVATVNNDGLVTSIAPGFVTFKFVESGAGCASAASTGVLAVVSCIDPDFNVTYVNVPVPGNVSTNDDITASVSYGPIPVLTSSPAGSTQTISINSDGTYTFTGSTVGVYTYLVPVCIAPRVSGCETSVLTITVLDYLQPNKRPVANVDFATTKVGKPVTLPTLANDKCVVTTDCTLDQATVTILMAPLRGSVTVAPNGNTTYTPNALTSGRDTLRYQVCVTAEPTNCANALQIITIEDTIATNSTLALDDFNTTAENTPVTGNVKTNDSDPQGDIQTVVAQTTTLPGGTLVLATDGSYTFTPSPLFFGPLDFPYETCDNNATQKCAEATLHILVVPDLAVKVRVYLQGPLINTPSSLLSPDGRPLMRDNLRVSPFNGNRAIPNKDPYKFPVTVTPGVIYDLTTGSPTTPGTKANRYRELVSGLLTKYDSVANPAAVFAVTGQNAIVDWVMVELRNATAPTQRLATRAGLLQRDGDVVDVDGVTPLKFPGMPMNNYYIAVKHRNHLSVMSKFAQTPEVYNVLVNFTTPSFETYDKGVVGAQNYTGLAQTAKAKTGWRAMWAGDYDSTGKIKFDNPNDDLNTLISNVFGYPTNVTNNLNFDFALGYLPGDHDLNGKAKFDNPNDDKNYLYSQIIGYPLNTSLVSNFDFLIEQLP